ncbi:MAG: hypothetical protein K6F01_02785 [Selenomonas sp.]|uniref:hypothetical protein n=1 Tax=Selenomonas sp. TaxID=2053611 RepID=UPI0025DD7885|nr:hypothetical protein [Selenomonas sp.]MCR5438362.1 hypothetical protein [Selenomonas sp.]
MNNSMDALASLQALVAKKKQKSGSSTAAKAGQASFADVWDQVKKEQQEWKETLDAVDLAQYKLSLADSFWSDRTKANQYLRNYVQRQQRSINQQNLTEITKNIAWLNQLNMSGVLNGNIDSEAASAAGKTIQTALQGLILQNIKNTSTMYLFGGF